MKNRLEEIKDKWADTKILYSEDINWLIEQSEQVQRLESLSEQFIGEEWMNDEGLYESEMVKLKQQNKHYREVLNFYADEDNYKYDVEANSIGDFEDTTHMIFYEVDSVIINDNGEKASKALEELE